MTAPTDLAKRLRERAEGCEFATDLALMHQAADALDRLAGVEAQCGEYLTQARIAEQMRQAATAERDRCAAVLLQREAELDEYEREIGTAYVDAQNAEAAYNVEHGLLVEWRERARAAEAIADAARRLVAEFRQPTGLRSVEDAIDNLKDEVAHAAEGK